MCVLQLELLQEDLAYVTEEVEKLSKVLEEKTEELQKAERLSAEKDMVIITLQEQVEPRTKSELLIFYLATFKTELKPPEASQSLSGMFLLNVCVCVCS